MNCDPDDLFGYTIPRQVVIRHRVLGLAHILMILGLIGYVVVYEVILKKGYLTRDEPLGFATLSLRRREWNALGDQPQCCPREGCGACRGGSAACKAVTSRGGCVNAPDADAVAAGCSWTPSEGLPAFGAPRGRLECVEWDRYSIVAPTAGEYSVLLTTRVTVTETHPLPAACVLNQTSVDCPSWDIVTHGSFYTTGVEDMRLVVDHGVYGRTTRQIVRAQDMASGIVRGADDAKLYSICGGPGPRAGTATPVERVQTITCSKAEQLRGGDDVSVRQLLAAAGLLDGLDVVVGDVDEQTADRSAETLRFDGVVLLVVIRYDGRGLDNDMDYTYSVHRLPGLQYRDEDVDYRDAGNRTATRQITERRGVRVILATAGYVAFFSFAELVKTMMIAMGLMSVARAMVEFVVIRLHPLSTAFSRYRYVKTIDFSDYTRADVKKLGDMDYALGTIRNGTEEGEGFEEVGERVHKHISRLMNKMSLGYGDDDTESPAATPMLAGQGQGQQPKPAAAGSSGSVAATRSGSLPLAQPPLPRPRRASSTAAASEVASTPPLPLPTQAQAPAPPGPSAPPPAHRTSPVPPYHPAQHAPAHPHARLGSGGGGGVVAAAAHPLHQPGHTPRPPAPPRAGPAGAALSQPFDRNVPAPAPFQVEGYPV